MPRSALRFEVYSENSFEEAENILELMRKQGWKTVIAVSDPPHMRRLAWTWHRVFKGSGLSYALVASAAQWWSPGDWWRDEHSARSSSPNTSDRVLRREAVSRRASHRCALFAVLSLSQGPCRPVRGGRANRYIWE